MVRWRNGEQVARISIVAIRKNNRFLVSRKLARQVKDGKKRAEKSVKDDEMLDGAAAVT